MKVHLERHPPPFSSNYYVARLHQRRQFYEVRGKILLVDISVNYKLNLCVVTKEPYDHERYCAALDKLR